MLPFGLSTPQKKKISAFARKEHFKITRLGTFLKRPKRKNTEQKKKRRKGSSGTRVRGKVGGILFLLSLFFSLSLLHDRSAGKKRKKDLLSLPFSPELAAEGSEGEEKEREREKQPVTAEEGPFTAKKGISL